MPRQAMMEKERKQLKWQQMALDLILMSLDVNPRDRLLHVIIFRDNFFGMSEIQTHT